MAVSSILSFDVLLYVPTNEAGVLHGDSRDTHYVNDNVSCTFYEEFVQLRRFGECDVEQQTSQRSLLYIKYKRSYTTMYSTEGLFFCFWFVLCM